MSSEITEPVYEGKFMGCNLVITKDAGLHHLSISRRDRLPNYNELKSARYQFLPDVPYMIQIFPPTEDFVNVHQFCLHLWEPAPGFSYSELELAHHLENGGDK